MNEFLAVLFGVLAAIALFFTGAPRPVWQRALACLLAVLLIVLTVVFVSKAGWFR